MGAAGQNEVTFKPMSRNRFRCNHDKVVVGRSRVDGYRNQVFARLHPRRPMEPVQKAAPAAQPHSSGKSSFWKFVQPEPQPEPETRAEFTVQVKPGSMGVSCPACNELNDVFSWMWRVDCNWCQARIYLTRH